MNPINNRVGRQISQMSNLAANLARTQQQISTGERLTRPSDDPNAATRIAAIDRSISANASWMRNADLANSLNSQAQTAVSAATTMIARLSELALSASSDSSSPEALASIAAEMESIASGIDALSSQNSSLGVALFGDGDAVALRAGDQGLIVPVPTRQDIFELGGQTIGDTIRGLAASVRANDNVAITAAITTSDEILVHLTNKNGSLGLTAQQIERSVNFLSDTKLELQTERSPLADTDLTEAIVRLQQQQLTLEAAQSSFSRINRRTLFDILS